MNIADIAVLALIAAALVRAALTLIKNKGSSCSCSGNCQSCKGCSCHSSLTKH